MVEEYRSEQRPNQVIHRVWFGMVNVKCSFAFSVTVRVYVSDYN